MKMLNNFKTIFQPSAVYKAVKIVNLIYYTPIIYVMAADTYSGMSSS